MTTEAYRQDLSRGMDPRDAEDAEAEREAFAQIERDSQPAPLVTVLPYIGPPQPTAEQIKRRNAKSPEACGNGTHKTPTGIREDWNAR